MPTNNVVSIASHQPIATIDPQRPIRRALAIIRLCVEAFGWVMVFGLCVAMVS